MFYYIENYWNKNCKPKFSRLLGTNQHFYFLKTSANVNKNNHVCHFVCNMSYLICNEIQLRFKLCALFNSSHNCYSLLIIYRLLIIYSVQFTLVTIPTIHNFFEIIIEYWQIKEFNDPWPCERGHDNHNLNFSVDSLSTSTSRLSSKQLSK